jgi:hypothetical protein
VSRTTARRGLSALIVLACLAAALLAVQAQPAPSRAPAFMLAADGALALQSDRHGVAILQAAGMRPGDGAEGIATLWATQPAALTLRAETGAEQPGTGGALLSERLVLTIDDVTVPSAPVAVYSGTLGAASSVAFGTLPAGIHRRYRFRVAFPRGTGDNALQAAALTARFVWTAVASGTSVTPTPTPTVAPAPVTAPPPSEPTPAPAAPAVASVTGLPAASGCLKRRRYTIGAKPRAGVRVTGIQVFVNDRKARTGRKPRKAKLNLKTQKRARITVRVVVRTTAGTVTVTRAYRLCRPRR